MTSIKMAPLLLRVGLAFSFLYAAISSFIEPSAWVGFFPMWLRAIVPASILLTGFSAVEIIIALWLLSGWRTFYAAIISVLMLAGIIVFNLSSIYITFRDVTILFAALALAALEKTPLDKRQ